jgi:hypothetical protein
MKTIPLIIHVPDGEYCDYCQYLEEIACCNLFSRTVKCKANNRLKCPACIKAIEQAKKILEVRK